MTRMQQVLSNISYLVGNEDVLVNMSSVPALPIFSGKVVGFLSELSNEIMRDAEAQRYSDIIAYAFWIRRKSIENSRERYMGKETRMGRGISFHIAPSNIPVQFAVAMVYSLISGNAAVIRVSSKMFEQTRIICRIINNLLKTPGTGIVPYICILKYDHDNDITEWISQRCDIRVIWGGNATINQIRKVSIPPRCVELGFADRYSFAVIDSDSYLNADYKVVARDFFIDTYYTDQNACSSSRLLIWTGGNIDTAKRIFWEYLNKEVLQNYSLHEISGSEKLLRTALCAVKYSGIKEIRENNAIVRISLPELFNDIMDYKGNSGYFFEYETQNLEEIIPLLKKECQTITFLGNWLQYELKKIILNCGVRGGDRIVPVGHSMNLSFVWDGYDLPLALSRVIGDS